MDYSFTRFVLVLCSIIALLAGLGLFKHFIELTVPMPEESQLRTDIFAAASKSWIQQYNGLMVTLAVVSFGIGCFIFTICLAVSYTLKGLETVWAQNVALGHQNEQIFIMLSGLPNKIKQISKKCSGCGIVYPSNHDGQFCEECGAKIIIEL